MLDQKGESHRAHRPGFRVDARLHDVLMDNPQPKPSLIIRTDGTLAPCFPMYSATHDFGVVEKPCFDPDQLRRIKRQCQPHCFSTLNHNLAYCYRASRAIKWTLKQALRGFRGTSGSFSD